MRLSEPQQFAINFRIPKWTDSPKLTVNGEAQPATAGTFATLARTWRDGDTIELTIPLTQRTQAIDEQHTNLVAHLRGPLVLVTTSPNEKIPFRNVTDQPYTMYVSQS